MATHKVKLVSGKAAEVMTAEEAAWFNESRDAYMDQLKFTETTDLRDLDRLLTLELMHFRWSRWSMAGEDYDGDMTDDEQLRKNIKEQSDAINKLKESMGLSKKARDAATAEGNFAAWIDDLKARAKVFGVHREKQLTKSLTLMKELATVVRAFDRCDAEERHKIGFESEGEIVTWIRNVMLPEYDVLDDYFRTHNQKYWVRDL